jgi:hypothetical protein
MIKCMFDKIVYRIYIMDIKNPYVYTVYNREIYTNNLLMLYHATLIKSIIESIKV